MNCLLASLSLLLASVALVAACGPRRDAFDVAPVDSVGMDIAPSCLSPLVLCGDQCVNLQSDSSNCATCGHACPGPLGCSAGACVLQCPIPEAACGGLCTSTQTDSLNCGACGAACPAGQVCSMGRCGLMCATGLMTCSPSGGDAGARDASAGRFCANLQTDRANCGACGQACAAGQRCIAGACVTECPPTQTLCGAACVDTTVDPAHCGACGHACPGGQTCVAGACSMACPTGQMYCTDRCLDVTGDRTNCGACGRACADGELCAMGTCAFSCTTGRVNCSMHCIDTNTDRAHCGACGTACAAGQLCVAGVCTITCAAGTTACGAACADLSSDHANCGACGTACTATQFCVGGACGASCLPGQTVCSGACVDTSVDANNCGYCGGTCGAGYGCLAGYCRPFVGTDASGCSPPSRQCGPTCTDVRSDNSNCGACGTVCGADRTCVDSMCVAPCAAGQIRCGGACTTVQFDRTNCGACGTVCAAGLGCAAGVCVPDPSFRITSLTSAGCTVIEASGETGADRGGLAVSLTRAMLNGNLSLGSYSAADLTGGTALGANHDTLTSDLRDGTVWVLLNAAGREPAYSFLGGTVQTVTQLGQLDGTTGALTATRVALSMPIAIDSTREMVGIFAGFGRLLIHGGGGTAARWWMIRLPSGEVTPLATRATPALVNLSYNSFAYFGIAEYYGGEPYAVYVQDRSHIARYRVSDGTITTIGTWTDLADMQSIGFSTSRNRWYFHHTFLSQFRPFTGGFPDQTLGFCNATFDTP